VEEWLLAILIFVLLLLLLLLLLFLLLLFLLVPFFVSFVAVAVGSTFAILIALCGGGFGLDCLLASLVFWV
jgi:hypothetical protein